MVKHKTYSRANNVFVRQHMDNNKYDKQQREK